MFFDTCECLTCENRGTRHTCKIYSQTVKKEESCNWKPVELYVPLNPPYCPRLQHLSNAALQGYLDKIDYYCMALNTGSLFFT
jgi:hypothetical protein